MNEVVWLHEHRRFGLLLKRDAYQSIIFMQISETEWVQDLVENDDYDLWEERAIDYESDDAGR